MQTYARPNLVFTHGEGARLYDAHGKEYLDFAAGIAVNALGRLLVHHDADACNMSRPSCTVQFEGFFTCTATFIKSDHLAGLMNNLTS